MRRRLIILVITLLPPRRSVNPMHDRGRKRCSALPSLILAEFLKALCPFLPEL